MQYMFISMALFLCSCVNNYHSFPQNFTNYKQRNNGVNISGNSGNFRSTINRYTANIRKQGPNVIYQYPVYQRSTTTTDKNMEYVPGIGNVIVAQPHAEDRFESKPLFAYKNKFGSSSASAPSLPSSYPSSKSNEPNPSYSSYNPPEFKPDNSPSVYPPFSQSSDAQFQKPSPVTSNTPPPNEAQDTYASLGPPLAPTLNNEVKPHHSDYDFSMAHPPASNSDSSHNDDDNDSFMDHPPSDLVAENVDETNNKPNPNKAPTMPSSLNYDDAESHPNEAHHHGPPSPPKNEDDVFYPPDFPKDQIPIKGLISAGSGSTGPAHPHSYRQSSFPDYLYDHDEGHQHDDHHPHHIYEEVHHATMAPVKEDKRVSSTHYSYYYLGRKLWYIPLYFSIYFIIYITVLIVKSIARHKVRIKYKWYEHDINAREGRSFNIDKRKENELSTVHRDVVKAIENFTEKYIRAM